MAQARRRTSAAAQPTSVAAILITVGVLGGLAATWFRLPGMVVVWLVLLVAALAEPAPVFTGPKDTYGRPTPAGVREFADQRRYAFLVTLRGRLFLHGGTLPGWPVRADWLLGVTLALLATALPLADEITGDLLETSGLRTPATIANATCTFLVVTGVAATRRLAGNRRPAPAMTTTTLGRVGPLLPVLVGSLLAGAAASALAHAVLPALVRRDLLAAPLPILLYALAVGLLVALGVATPTWRAVTREEWERTSGLDATWEGYWTIALGGAARSGLPVLQGVRAVGPITVLTFEAPAGLGATGCIALAPKLAPTLGAGVGMAIVPTPNLDSSGAPMPGTQHPLRFEVTTHPVDQAPDVTDPATTPELAAYVITSALARAVDRYGQGGAAFRLVEIRPLHVRAPAVAEPTGWGRLRTIASGEQADHQPDTTGPEGEASPRAAWALTLVSDGNELAFVRSSYAGLIAQALGCEVMVNDWPPASPQHPGGGAMYVGALSDPDTVWEPEGVDGADWPKVMDWMAREDHWNAVWRSVLKQGANFPEPQLGVQQTDQIGRTTITSLGFTIRWGQEPGEFAKLESRLATALGAAPFVSTVAWPSPDGQPGGRHPQAFTLRWSDGPVPAKASNLAPVRATRGMGSAPAWLLAGMVTAAFDRARLARPEVYDARCLTRPTSRGGHLWRLEMRLHDGVTLADVRSRIGAIGSVLAVDFLRVATHTDPQCLVMVLGADYRKVEIADPGREGPFLVDLDWQQAWLDAKVTTEAGLTPRMTGADTMPRNPKVQVLDFALPSGIPLDRVKGAVPKLRGSTRNDFMLVAPGIDGPSSARILASTSDPMPWPAEPDWAYVAETAADPVIPFGAGVDGSPVAIDLREDPHVALMGTTGSGKAQPLDSVVPVPVSARFPTGLARNGDLQVGDEVLTADGGLTTVVGFSETRTEPVYVLTLDDGQEVRCSGHHLWVVTTRAQRSALVPSRVAKRGRVRGELTERLDHLAGLAQSQVPGAVAPLADIAAYAGVGVNLLRSLGAAPLALERTALYPTTRRSTVYPMDQVKAHLRGVAQRSGQVTFDGRCLTVLDIDDLGLDGQKLDVRSIAHALAGSEPTRAQRDLARQMVRRSGVRGAPGLARVAKGVYPVNEVLALLADHWRAQSLDGRAERRAVLHTQEMLESVRTSSGAANFAIDLAPAVELPERDLPVPPYVLGMWLGDGDARRAGITVGGTDLAETRERLKQEWGPVAREDPHPVADAVRLYLSSPVPGSCHHGHTDWQTSPGGVRSCRPCRRVRGPRSGSNLPLGRALGRLGVLGDKHIPPAYLRASIQQRLALLQGLMDTDGSIGRKGACELTLCNRRLALDSLDLIRSLGIKASMSIGDASITEPDPDRPDSTRRRIVGTRYRIHFTTDVPVFRLRRKLERIPARVRGTQRRLFITDIRVEKAVPQRCLRTRSARHTYLTDGFVPTHNSVTAAFILTSVLMKGWDAVLVDVKKKGGDFAFARPWLLAVGTEYEEAVAVLEAAYAEVQRRIALYTAAGCGSVGELPEAERPRRLVVYLDEFNGLITVEKPAKPVTEDPDEAAEYARAMRTVQQKMRIGALTGYIAKEARSAHVTLVLAGQAFKQDTLKVVPGGGELKGMLSRLALGKMSYGEYQWAVREPERVPPLGEVVPKGRGVYESQGAATAIVQGWWTPQAQARCAEQIAARRQPLTEQERWDLTATSRPVAEPVVEGVVIQEAAEVDLGELVFDLGELDLGDLDLTPQDPVAPAQVGPPEPGPEPVPVLDAVVLTDQPGAAEWSSQVWWVGPDPAPPGCLRLPLAPAQEGLHPHLAAVAGMLLPDRLVWVAPASGGVAPDGEPYAAQAERVAPGSEVLALPDSSEVSRAEAREWLAWLDHTEPVGEPELDVDDLEAVFALFGIPMEQVDPDPAPDGARRPETAPAHPDDDFDTPPDDVEARAPAPVAGPVEHWSLAAARMAATGDEDFS